MITQRAHSAAVGTLGRVQRLRHPAPTRRLESKAACIDIGLINNMPDAALDATVRQFRGLLAAAAEDVAIRLTLYTLPEVPRSDFGRRVGAFCAGDLRFCACGVGWPAPSVSLRSRSSNYWL